MCTSSTYAILKRAIAPGDCWRQGPDIGGGHIKMVHTAPNATSAKLEQTAVAVFSSLAEHPEHICSLSIRDLPYAKKGLSGGASRLYIQSALAQELLCPPLAELSQSMKPGGFRGTGTLSSMPIGADHLDHCDPRAVYGFLSQRSKGKSEYLGFLELALTNTNVFSQCAEIIQQWAGATVFDCSEVDCNDIDPETLWLKPGAHKGRRIRCLRLPGDAVVFSAAFAAGGCCMTDTGSIELATSMAQQRVVHRAGAVVTSDLPSELVEAMVASLESKSEPVIMCMRSAPSKTLGFDPRCPSPTLTVEAACIALTNVMQAWLLGQQLDTDNLRRSFNRDANPDQASKIDDIWRGRVLGGRDALIRVMGGGATGMKQTVEQQEACADDMRTSLRHKELSGESFAANPAAQALQKTNPRLTPLACLTAVGTAVGITESFAASLAAQALQKANPRLTPLACLTAVGITGVVRRQPSCAGPPEGRPSSYSSRLSQSGWHHGVVRRQPSCAGPPEGQPSSYSSRLSQSRLASRSRSPPTQLRRPSRRPTLFLLLMPVSQRLASRSRSPPTQLRRPSRRHTLVLLLVPVSKMVRRLESFAANPAAQAKQIADNLRTTAMYVAHEETKRLFDNRAKANLLQRAHDVQVDPAIIARWQNGAPGTEEAFLKRALLIAIKRGVKTASKKQKVHG